jgi:hypothetical protein
MADDTTAAPAEGIFTPSLPADTGPINAIDAGRLISEARAKQAQPEAKTDQPRVNGRFASAAAETQSPSQEDDAARPQDATGETQEADPAEQPPLELPRSWSKDKAEVWKARSVVTTQEHLLDHDKTASARSDVSRTRPLKSARPQRPKKRRPNRQGSSTSPLHRTP